MSSDLYLLKPALEVGGKLAIRNVTEVRQSLRHWLKMGLKRCQLICFVSADKRAQLFSVVAFCRKYIETEPELVGWIRDEGGRITSDRDMLYVVVEDAESRKYSVGILDQPKRRVLSLPTRAMGLH